MKELTIEEKAKAYDEALKVLHKYDGANIMFSQSLKEEMFPELKESEDEKVRNEIIAFVEQSIHRGGGTPIPQEQKNKWIEWLEKKGKTSTEDFGEFINILSKQFPEVSFAKLSRIAVRVKKWLEKQGEQKLPIEKLPSETKTIGKSLGFTTQEDCDRYNQMVSDLIMSDDDKGEQKPADKAEPKFKVGDWIVSKTSNLVYRVDSILFPQSKCYYLSHNGGIVLVSFADEQNYRLWTIKDAKDGDVLADNYGIYIFDRFDEYDERCYLCRGAYQYSQKEYENRHMICSVEVHPATKEQRDLLFAKMHEAGYEWDAEKKELKKIDKENLTEFEIAVKNVMEEAIEAGDTHNLKADAENLLRITQPTWGEDDEKLAQAKKDAYNDALDKIEYHSGEPTFDDGWDAAIWYLKKKG